MIIVGEFVVTLVVEMRVITGMAAVVGAEVAVIGVVVVDAVVVSVIVR